MKEQTLIRYNDFLREVQQKLKDEVGLEISISGINAVIKTMAAALMTNVVAGHSVRIPHFATFGSRARAGRTGRNPATGEWLTIPATTVATVRLSHAFKKLWRT